MKTALAELIEKWENINIVAKHTSDAPLVKAFIESAKFLLGKEQQQIIDSFQGGVSHGQQYFLGDDSYALKYFNQTFLSNENIRN